MEFKKAIFAIMLYAVYAACGAVAVSAGAGHSLLLESDGSVWAWGLNDCGQLGNGTTSNSAYPVRVIGEDGIGFLENIVAVSAGFGYSVALKSDGTVCSWGRNDYGQLGDGTTTSAFYPVSVLDSSGFAPLGGIARISTGVLNVLASDVDSCLWVWGSNREGCLGIGSSDDAPHPLPIRVMDSSGSAALDGIIDISAGTLYNIVVKADGSVWSWGSYGDGQLGIDTLETSRYRPSQVRGEGRIGTLMNVASVAACPNGIFYIYGHSLAKKRDGSLWAWGRNYNGQLGDGTTDNAFYPVRVRDEWGTGYIDDVASIRAGTEHSLALLSDGTVWAWGNNYYGALGNGGTADSHFPIQVHGGGCLGFLTDITAISTSHCHNLALAADGTVWAWGRNNYGQLGDGTTTQRYCPVEVAGLPVGIQIKTAQYPAKMRIFAYPNPFNSAVTISLSAGVGASDARPGQVGIKIYDISGRLVADLPVTNCGSPQFVPTPQIWQPDKSLGSGVYLVRANIGENIISKRIVYLK